MTDLLISLYRWILWWIWICTSDLDFLCLCQIASIYGNVENSWEPNPKYSNWIRQVCRNVSSLIYNIRLRTEFSLHWAFELQFPSLVHAAIYRKTAYHPLLCYRSIWPNMPCADLANFFLIEANFLFRRGVGAL